MYTYVFGMEQFGAVEQRERSTCAVERGHVYGTMLDVGTAAGRPNGFCAEETVADVVSRLGVCGRSSSRTHRADGDRRLSPHRRSAIL